VDRGQPAQWRRLPHPDQQQRAQPGQGRCGQPARPNRHGHIIRWHDSDDHQRFTWDIFVFGANAAGGPDINRSGLTEMNQFASPDGMSFDSRGVLWFETDNGEQT
jgi:secreted PhoX family phosphatase